jgi:glucose-1-phosphate thymidylyltransferase
MRLIIPIGGRGTRLRPFSHTHPKPLLPLLGRPAIAHILDAFRGALGRPVDEVVFVLGPEMGPGVLEALTAACGDRGLQASFALQPTPLGTAHAIACAGELLDGEVLTCWADTLFTPASDTDLSGADLVAWTVEVEDPRRFGVVERDASGRVVRLVEKPQKPASRETLIGAYYVRDGAALRRTVEDMIASGARGAGGEYQLTDAYDRLVRAGKRMITAPAARWLDIGTLESYRETIRALLDAGEYDGAGPQREGVRVVRPSFVHPEATVLRSVIGPYAALEDGAVAEGSVLQDTLLMAGAVVQHAALEGSLLGERARAVGVAGSFILGDDSSAMASHVLHE